MSPDCLQDKYNFLPAYQLDTELSIVPKPMPVSATKLLLNHTNKLFGIVYITPTGMIDTIILASGLCANPLVGSAHSACSQTMMGQLSKVSSLTDGLMDLFIFLS
ncbi:hypothetical protein DSO57_1022201 [Entomophthora muscae]|uniref:Uncharacterized protein n=1 Tax=Entomophthora muscae TaxID=34485 RepID=A0ACC2T383_9FUNG|nr:hypothetical protein DSO57_1022201 [Entomophthora muscae]